MERITEIESFLEEIRQFIGTDYMGLAWSENYGQILRCKYVSGNRNERYKRMMIRFGKGVAGNVLRSGQTIVVNSFAPKRYDDPAEYSILLAEGLTAIVGAPVFENGKIKGVLVAGYRDGERITEEVTGQVKQMAARLSAMIQAEEVGRTLIH